eukprot:scaffold2486_cov107-Phaeocystis_antarctica.AAC.1
MPPRMSTPPTPRRPVLTWSTPASTTTTSSTTTSQSAPALPARRGGPLTARPCLMPRMTIWRRRAR